MSVSATSNSTTNTVNRRQDVDRRQQPEAVALDRRQQTDRRVDNGTATQAKQSTPQSGNASATPTADTVFLSSNSQQSKAEGEGKGFGSFLKNFEGSFDNKSETEASGQQAAVTLSTNSSSDTSGNGLASDGDSTAVQAAGPTSGNGTEPTKGVSKQSKNGSGSGHVQTFGPNGTKKTDEAKTASETKPTSEAKPVSPEEQHRDFLEKTGKSLYNASGFTAGEDGKTSRGDYQAIADGKRNEEYGKYLKDKNPDMSDADVQKEVANLQESSKNLLKDQSAFDFYDNATNQGDARDQSISSQDLASGRLRNDTSKEYPPKLSADEIAGLHEQNPTLGNEAVTNKYYHQSKELNERLGGNDKSFNATWPAYGQMASNSAGELIRDDGIPNSDCLQNTVAEGNRKVFKDIAPHYDSYLKASKDPNFDYDKWADKEFGKRPEGVESLSEASKKPGFDLDKWKQSIKDAENTSVKTTPDGKEQSYKDVGKPYLRESFDMLEAAANEKDPDRKQELLLGSNVMGGRHEQQNLQPEIAKATAPMTGTTVERVAGEAFVDKDPTLYMPNDKGHGKPSEYKVDEKLGGTPSKGLEEITDPSVRAALAVGLNQNKVADSYNGQDLINNTGTENWADLDARMQTITGLMVAKQTDPNMGQYILDYDKPRGSTTGMVGSVLTNVKEKATSVVEGAVEGVKDGVGAVYDWGKGLFG